MRVANRIVVGGLAFLAGLFIVLFLANGNASSAVNHGQLVNDDARRDLPLVLDGDVLAHAQVGNRIFVGGNFQQVERIDGSVITQPHIFAYDINTGLIDENFRPVLDNNVNALEASPNQDALYVGGRFTRWDGTWVGRLTKLSPEGVNDSSFSGRTSAIIRDLAVTDSSVYAAGDFLNVNGTTPRLGFAAFDRNTGAVDTGFVADVQNSANGNQLGRGIVATTDGNTVFGLHFGRQINGVDREAVVKIDVGGATANLANWEIDWSGQAGRRECLDSLRDIAISPNNAFIVIGGQGADNAPNCDTVLRYNTGGTGIINLHWAARMYSSVFSLAVSDVAVYAGGHFCAAPAQGAPVGGITHDPDTGPSGTANSCDTGNPNSSVNPHIRFPNHAVFRNQMAALNPNNGQALNWDPGSNNRLAVHDLTLIDRGLLAGHDNDRFSNFLVGRSGFFDFGVPEDVTPPTITVTSPTDDAILDDLDVMTGTAEDDREIRDVRVRLRNLTTGDYLQADGATFGPTAVILPITTTSTGLGTVDWSVNINADLPPGEYQIRSWATDPEFQSSPQILTQFRIAGAAACTVALNGDDVPVISWSEFSGVQVVQVRRNGAWISAGTPDSGTHTDAGAVPGQTYSYSIRWFPGGVSTDVACTPASITVPAVAQDTTPPVVTFTTGLTQQVGSVDLTGGVTDDISGVNRMRVLIRNQQTGEYWNSDTSSWQAGWKWNIPALSNGNTAWTLPNVNLAPAGTYTVQLWAWDNDENRAFWTDNPNPTITVN